MDIIELFYERVRAKQRLHVLIQAHIKEFEYIPFIENNTLVQNSFYESIPKNAKSVLSHISRDMCSPYDKRKYNDESSKYQIKNLQKYSVYLLKNRNKTNLNSETLTKKAKLDDPLKVESSSFLMKEVRIGQLKPETLDTSALINILKTGLLSDKQKFIYQILQTIMKDDYLKESLAYQRDPEKEKQLGLLDNIEQSIKTAVQTFSETQPSEDAYNTLIQSIVDTVNEYYNQFKDLNFDMELFRNTVYNTFTSSEIKPMTSD